MKLYTFGDCHADAPWVYINVSDTKFDQIDYNGIYSFTMSRIGFQKPKVFDISGFYLRTRAKPTYDPELREEWSKYTYPYRQYFNVHDGDAVVFSFGEIDCRTHLTLPQYSDMWKGLIDAMIPPYFETIKMNVSKFKHLHTMIFNIVPTPTDENFLKHNNDYIRNGTEEHRKNVILYMNNKLKEYCGIYNFIFLDVYNKYADENGFLKFELSDRGTHLRNPIHVVEFLNNLDIYN